MDDGAVKVQVTPVEIVEAAIASIVSNDENESTMMAINDRVAARPMKPKGYLTKQKGLDGIHPRQTGTSVTVK